MIISRFLSAMFHSVKNFIIVSSVNEISKDDCERCDFKRKRNYERN